MTSAATDMSTAGGDERTPREPDPPFPFLGWIRAPNPKPRRFAVPIWARVAVAIAVTLGLGIWGYRQLHVKPRLDFIESLYAAIKLYTLDLGPAGGSSPGPDWQIWVALILAAGLVARGVFALGRVRVRRAAVRHLLRGHVIVCGAGVHGTRLVQLLADDYDVVLVDLDPLSPGMQQLPVPHEWRLIGDCATEGTLLGAGVRRAHWVIPVTGNDFVNSQIVSAVRGLAATGDALDRVHVMVQVEDPSLARFLEEEGDPSDHERTGTAPGAHTVEPLGKPIVSPFSANAIAAEALLDDSKVRVGDGEGALLAMRAGRAPNLLLVGDHPLIDAVILAALRRWRVRILREDEENTERKRPPIHVSLYGPGAEQRAQRLRDRWRPEPNVLTLEGRDSPPADAALDETDLWLQHPGRADHAIVVCRDELDGIALTLGVARALGDGARMTRVTTQFENALDAHVEERTAGSRHMATTEVKSIADLGADRDEMRGLPAPERLARAIRRTGDEADAPLRARELFDRAELGLRSDSGWRIRKAERPMLEALLQHDTAAHSVPLSAVVRAGLRVDLASSRNLLTAAQRLSTGQDPAAFATWCEYLRRLPAGTDSSDLASLQATTHDRAADWLLALRRATLGDAQGLDGFAPGGHVVKPADRVVILAGAAGSMAPAARRALEPMLDRALSDYDGVVLSGGTGVGIPGIAGRVAQRQHLRLVGYTPVGMAAPELYDTLRETPESTEFSVLEPLTMWTDVLRAGVPAGRVRLLVCPGGEITIQEILLARALGAQIGFIDPASDATAPLDDLLPFGSAGVLELPADAMTIRALINPTELPPPLRNAIARYVHNDYRRAQRHRKSYSDPALAPWDELLPSLQASNLAQADHIPSKLTLIGKRLVQPGEPLELSDEQVELLAEVEHGRWNVERLAAGWRVGERQLGRSTSPDLKPWTELADATREYDREAVRNLGPALADAGWGVVDV
jgi:TrkA-N domain/RyR domain